MNKKVPLGVTIALIVVAITASIAITMEIAMHTCLLYTSDAADE